MASLRAVIVSSSADGTPTAIRFVETDYRHLSTVNESLDLSPSNKKRKLVRSANLDVSVPDPEWLECWRTSQAAVLQVLQPFDEQRTGIVVVKVAKPARHLPSQTDATEGPRRSSSISVPEGVL